MTTELCRFCMGATVQSDLFKSSLYYKTTMCLNLKPLPGDGLPSSVCLKCENNINNFYEFKIACLESDSKFREQLSKDITEEINTLVKVECSFNNNDPKDIFDSWLDVDSPKNYDDKQNNIILAEKDFKECPPNKEVPTRRHDDDTQKECETDIKHSTPFQCELCGCLLKTKAILQNHLVTHSGVKLFSCKICSKQFTRAAHKVEHMRIHMGVKPYICEICGQASIKKQDLKRHLKVHSDEKNYQCPMCSKRFKRSADIHTHIRTHTGARPYKCTNCNKCYASHSGLRKHWKMHCKKDK